MPEVFGARERAPVRPVATAGVALALAGIEVLRLTGALGNVAGQLAPPNRAAAARWQPFTSPWVQTVGWARQFVPNLALLFVFGPRAERRFGSAWTVGTFVGAGVATEIVRRSMTGSVNAGSSTAALGVAGALASANLAERSRAAAWTSVGCALAGGSVILRRAGDGHVLAFAFGSAAGLAAPRIQTITE